MEVWFYHLQRQPLEMVLPSLLEKCLERGWRAIVETQAERLGALDDLLWSYAPASFLPHGLEGADQPILLTSAPGNPNAAQIRIFADAPAATPQEAYQRIIVIFDGNDAEKLARARREWAQFKAEGHALAYWQQGETGGWVKKA